MNKEKLKEFLNKEQYEACITGKNTVLIACPGSGKTRTITYRLAHFSTLYNQSQKLNIAITYTNRAADEIRNRLELMDIDISNVWTGTIHQFCMNYIIRPYHMYHKRTSKGYTIIDEFVKDNYLKLIGDTYGIKKDDLYNNEFVEKQYNKMLEEKNEIDFDLILEISNELLKTNKFIADNISNLIRSINIDEYQDTNQNQYEIISRIFKANKKIIILFTGDPNQAIYTNLGGISKSKEEINELFDSEFNEMYLHGCYRSTQRIVEYYTNFEVENTEIESVAKIKNEIRSDKI